MNVDDFNKTHNITHYRLDTESEALVRLVNGTLVIRLPYILRAEDGTEKPEAKGTAVATEQQLADMLTIFAAIVPATNARIEDVHGWVAYVPDD